LTREFKGPTTGFVATSVIYDKKTDTEGYIGYLTSDKSIYVVFRGSISTKNWLTDFLAIKVPYTSFPECNCEVHEGFYNAEQRVIDDIIHEVGKLKAKFPEYAVKVTGHSLGAALAQITSMDLFKVGYNVTVYNFGQPRTGDKKYAEFATERVQTFRVVHDRDVVPHLPFTIEMEFYHVCQEQFEDAAGNVRSCLNGCEDPTCADQYQFIETNGDDHVVYLGLNMVCESV
jgi:predicted lipase